jgi:hypothetical protein
VSPSWRSDAPPNLVKLAVARCLIDRMDSSRWIELGLLTNTSDVITGHARLLRSLHFGDDDYDGCVFQVVGPVLDEQQDPVRDPWDPQAKDPEPLSLLEKFPNLETVVDFIELPAWLARNDEKLFDRVLVDPARDGDATLPDGTVLSAAESAAARLEVAEMRRQVERIRRDHADDPEAAIGQAKELVETVCKTILGMTGDAPEAGTVKFPALVKKTLLHLGIDPTQVDDMPLGAGAGLAHSATDDRVQVKAAKQVLGGVSSVLNGADELRNARGTGHGRSGSPLISDALARLTVGMVLPSVIYLIEVFENRTGSKAPHLIRAPASASPSSLSVGDFVRHETFGEGRVIESDGEGRKRVISVDFGLGIGTKRLLLRYAPLQVVR